MSLQVRARDKEFKPLDNATVKITVTPMTRCRAMSGCDKSIASPESAATIARLNAEPALAEAGLYETPYVPRVTGGYLAEAVVTDADGVEVGRAQAGWTADPAAEEFKSLKPNRALLENHRAPDGRRSDFA